MLTQDKKHLFRANCPDIRNKHIKDLTKYNDDEMVFRKKLLRNIEFLADVDQNCLTELAIKLEKYHYD